MWRVMRSVVPQEMRVTLERDIGNVQQARHAVFRALRNWHAETGQLYPGAQYNVSQGLFLTITCSVDQRLVAVFWMEMQGTPIPAQE